MLSRVRCGLGVLRSIACQPRHAPSLPNDHRVVKVGLSARSLCACSILLQSAQDEAQETENSPQGIKSVDSRRGRTSNWNYTAELFALAQRLGHDPKEVPSLRVALVHRSALAKLEETEGSEKKQHNGRLAVLGRSILSHYVQECLYFAYRNMEGNHLLDMGRFLTSPETLTKVANYLGVKDLIRTKYKPSDTSGGHIITSSLCAIIGALYIDKSPQAARTLVHDFVLTQLAGQDMHEIIKLRHPKFMLSAILKGQGQQLPRARLLRESGRLTHFPSFVVGVYSGEKLLAEGCGTSLKRAEKEAVLAALHKHFQTELRKVPLPSDHEDFLEEGQLNLFSKLEEEQST